MKQVDPAKLSEDELIKTFNAIYADYRDKKPLEPLLGQLTLIALELKKRLPKGEDRQDSLCQLCVNTQYLDTLIRTYRSKKEPWKLKGIQPRSQLVLGAEPESFENPQLNELAEVVGRTNVLRILDWCAKSNRRLHSDQYRLFVPKKMTRSSFWVELLGAELAEKLSREFNGCYLHLPRKETYLRVRLSALDMDRIQRLQAGLNLDAPGVIKFALERLQEIAQHPH